MSPRAAWRLARLGFTAYDYVGGKADWLAAGLPTEPGPRPHDGDQAHDHDGAVDHERRALDAADRAPPTCGPDDQLDAVAARFPGRTVVVVGEDGVVLGAVDPGSHGRLVPGPTTVRADEPLGPLLERMAAHHAHEVVVTTPEGRLLGVVRAATLNDDSREWHSSH